MTLIQSNGIDGETSLVGYIGRPSAPWSSPRIYNTAFRAAGLNWRCVPLPVTKGRLRDALAGLRALGFAGAELADPHQEEALHYLDQVSHAAEMVGAVKYIQVDERGRLVGYNTCWLGFLATLRMLVPSLNGLRPLVIGAGHAARSVVYALTREGIPVTIVNERMDEAIDLVHRMRHVLDEHNLSVYRWPQDQERVAAQSNLIVNATSMGTWPEVDRSPWPRGLAFPPGALVFDLVSWPIQTRFLQQAEAAGVQTVNGLWLLVYGAALAYERWTGQSPPIQVMWAAAEEVLAQQMAPAGTRSASIVLV